MTKMNGQAFIKKAGNVGKIFPNNKMKEMSGFPGLSFVMYVPIILCNSNLDIPTQCVYNENPKCWWFKCELSYIINQILHIYI